VEGGRDFEGVVGTDQGEEVSDHCRTIAELDLGVRDYTWRIDSDCGVVKLHSSRDGCMIALNSHRARELAWEFYDGVIQAAASVDRASRGEER
jgi:hypothetical protein